MSEAERTTRLTDRCGVHKEMSRLEALAERLEDLLGKLELLAYAILRVNTIHHLYDCPPEVGAHDGREHADILLGDENILREFAGRRDLGRLPLRRDALM
jgi:hypothetical protein